MIYLSEKNTLPMVFCFENYSDLLWENMFLLIENCLCELFNIWNRTFSQLVTGDFSDVKIATIKIPIGTSNFNVKT